MSGNINGIETAGKTSHLTVVGAAGDVSATQTRSTTSSGVTFGAAVETSNRHNLSVRAIAARYDNFQDALLPMVLASGVTGEAAVAVAEAIMANPALRAQAERAFQRAQLTSM